MQKPSTQGMTGEYWDFLTTLKRCQAQLWGLPPDPKGWSAFILPSTSNSGALETRVLDIGFGPVDQGSVQTLMA